MATKVNPFRKNSQGSLDEYRFASTGTIVDLTGYEKPNSATPVTASDNVNQAIGKLEAALEGKQPTGNYLTTTSNLDASKLTGTVPEECYTNTTYNDFVGSGEGAARGLVPNPGTTAGTTKYLREDGTWQVPPDTNTTYNNFVGSGASAAAGLVPAPSTTAGNTKYLREDGSWQVPPDTNTTYDVFVGSGSSAAAGLVPKPSNTAGTTKYLREDGNWAEPTDTKYTGSNGITLTGTNFTNSGVRAVAEGATDGTISVNTNGTSTEVPVHGLGSAAYTDSSDYASATHDHVGSDVTLTGYTKAATASAVAATDNVNQAIGKIEKSLDGKQAAGNYLTPNSQIDATKISGTIPPESYIDTTYENFVGSGIDAASGLVPKPPTTAGTTKYLREDGTWQVPPDNNTTYTSSDGITLTGTNFTNSGVRAVNEGTVNGTVSVNTNGNVKNVAVKGLGTAAYTDSGDYASANHTHTVSEIGAAAEDHTHCVADITDFPTIPTISNVFDGSSSSGMSGIAVKSAVDSALTSAYKPSGSVAYASLPTLGASVMGNVYNVSNEFTIDNRFIEYESGKTKTFPAGTEVAVINSGTSSSPVYKFSVMSGFIDLSGYQLKTTAVTHTASTAAGASNKPVYVNSSGVATACAHELNSDVPSNAVFTDTTYSNFVGSGSSAAAGLVPAPSTTAGTTKYLREDGSWQVPPDTKYEHPTTAGNKHIPSGGSEGKILKWSANGTAVWGDETTTTYDDFIGSGSSAAHGLVPKPPTTAGTTKYLREDGNWVVPPDNDTKVGSGITLTGYSKASSAAAVTTTDTVNTAIGKLEKGLDGKQAAGSYAAASHTHVGTEVTLTGYSKASSTAAVAATDNVNTAIGKLEKGLDGKQAAGSYLTPSSTLDATKLSGTIPTSCYTDTKYNDFVGSGSSAAHGLVPKPPTTAGTTKYLREDGSWVVPPNDNTTVGSGITLTGYTKASAAAAVAATDTVNAAIGKLEKALDGKQASGSYLTPSSSLDASKLSGTIPTSCYTDTKYNDFVGSGSSAAHGLVPAPSTTAGTTKYLREDGSWQVPPDTKYEHPTTAGNKHIPSGGSSGQILKYSADGTAVWATEYSYTHPSYTARTGKPTANATPAFGGTFTISQITSDSTGHVTGATDRTITIPATVFGAASSSAAGSIGLVKAPAAGDQAKFLRGDSTWAVPTDTKYSAGTGLSLSGTTFNHSNSVTAGTVGTDSATSGSTLAVPYVTFDDQGHITATGTHTHTVTGFAATSHGNHVPTTQTANNAVFLRNDNTWQTVTPANIGAAAASHNQASSTINAMTGYSKPSSTSAIGTSDTLNAAIGKLEKALDGKQASGSYAAASHTHTTADVTALTGYAIASSAAAIAATDSLNTALGKLQKSIDGKQAAGSYAAASHTHNYAGSSSAGGVATSAAKLSTPRAIDGVNFDGSAAITHFGTCDTAAATAAKTVACTSFTLVTGSRIVVKFTVTNTAASPTLNVNSTGDKAIQYRGSAISAGYLAANRTYEFIYDGTNYQLVGDLDTNTTYSANNGVSLSGTTFSNSGVRSIATGSTNGTISVNTGGTSAEVAVKGLASGAYAAAYVHPSYTARTGKPTANATPAFGGTVTVSQITSDSLGHVTGATDRTITIPSTVFGAATSSAAGSIGLVKAPAAGDQAKFLRGDATWAVPTNTKNTAGSTNSASKLFLVGAASQAANPQTYSHSSVYETAGVLNATSYTIDTHGAIAYNSGTGCVEITVA